MSRNTYGQTYMSRNKVIGISGIIGAGKTTLADCLLERLGKQWMQIKEPVETNPYLEKFYADKEKYGFAMQVFLLSKRFSLHQSMVWASKSCIVDRTIYEDVIFAKMLHETGNISDLDFNTYRSLFDDMANFLHRPDLIIYLDVTPETALGRIKKRGRACEAGMPLEYLQDLEKGYLDWLETGVAGRIPIIRLAWNDNDALDDRTGKIKNSVIEGIVDQIRAFERNIIDL